MRSHSRLLVQVSGGLLFTGEGKEGMRSKRVARLLLNGIFLMPIVARAEVYMVWLEGWEITKVLVFESATVVANQFDSTEYIIWTGGFTAGTLETSCPNRPLLLSAQAFTQLQEVIDNSDPVADVGGPYSGYGSLEITLTAAGSHDADHDITTYEWDFDNDGQYDDAPGVTAAFSSASLGEYTMRVRVTDEHGASDTDTATLTVRNFTIESFTLLDERLSLSWQSLNGYTYTVLHASSLTHEWQSVVGCENMPGTGGSMSVTNMPTAENAGFYQLSTVPE